MVKRNIEVKRKYIKPLIVIGAVVCVAGVIAFISHVSATQYTSVNIKQVLADDKVDSFITANTISINNTAFGPTALTVDINSTVTWVNNDTVAHTLTFTFGAKQSITIQPKGVYTYKVTQPITYTYTCSGMPNELGTITVTDPNFTTLKRGG